uniref:Endonuclease/exonuclease/phosphatase domain-containing protein n=1 Tax=Oryzias latipes TaxID=8090 RepID=A0A3P9KGE1_ORYLA
MLDHLKREAEARPIKRKKVLGYLKFHDTGVAFIQETHFGNDKETLKMRRDWVGKVFHNSVSSKSRGVMTLLNKKRNFVFLKQLQDDDGRLLCIQALINEIKVVLVNVYAPNGDEPDFIYKSIKMLSNLKGQILIGQNRFHVNRWPKPSTDICAHQRKKRKKDPLNYVYITKD